MLNFEKITKLYSDGKYTLSYFVGLLYGKMPMGNETIYHRTVYDFSSMKSMLESLSYRKVSLYDWRDTSHSEFDDHSQAYLPHMDKDNGVLMSLNVECVK